MKTIIAIDPGTLESAIVLWEADQISSKDILPNERILDRLVALASTDLHTSIVVIEQVRSYGMAVGAEVFDTVFWSGRFAERWASHGGQFAQMPRMDVKMFWCKSAKAKDANIWAAMKDRFGEPGKKAAPGFLFGVTSHERAALALAVAFAEREVQS